MTIIEFIEELLFAAYAVYMLKHDPWGDCICRSSKDEAICVRSH